jgi:hypothetical protein
VQEDTGATLAQPRESHAMILGTTLTNGQWKKAGPHWEKALPSPDVCQASPGDQAHAPRGEETEN